MIKLNIHHDLCPCGSDKLIKDCCLTADGELIPIPCNTSIPTSHKKYGNPNCYASVLSNCSNKLSREHFVSKGILEILNVNETFQVGGLPWQQNGLSKNIPPKAFASNILCDNHNSSLSSLDTKAIELFKKFTELETYFNEPKSSRIVHLFNGHDIERWMLKMLCGCVASGNASYKNIPIRNWKPPENWLKILFDIEQLPNKWGLYFVNVPGDWIKSEAGITFAPLTNGKTIYGCILEFHGFKFILAMSDPPDDKSGTLLSISTYRPKELHFFEENTEKIILFMFGWTIKGDEQTVKIQRHTSNPNKLNG